MFVNPRAILTFSCAALIFMFSAIGCSSDKDSDYRETLTQVSTIDTIINGIYDGVMSYDDVEDYGNFGIGTFEGLDGEMIALDGEFYQIKADGIAYAVEKGQMTPFAAITFFEDDQAIGLEHGLDYASLQEFIDGIIPTENIFYAIRIDGNFSYMKTRSVPGQTKPYPPLVEVTANQPIFEFSDVSGTLVGFRSPPYVTGINVPGYHLHFIDDARTGGGHVLDFRLQETELKLDHTSEFFMILPEGVDDFYQLDLSQDKGEELEEAER